MYLCSLRKSSCTPEICISQFAGSGPYLLSTLVSSLSFLNDFRPSESLNMLFLLYKCLSLLETPFNDTIQYKIDFPAILSRSSLFSLLTLNTIHHHIFICIYLSNPPDWGRMWSPTSIQHQLRTC